MLDRPTLSPRQNYLYGIYSEISRSRRLSQTGVLQLGMPELESYVNYWKIQRLDDREEIFRVVAALDDVYCEIVNKSKDKVDKPRVK